MKMTKHQILSLLKEAIEEEEASIANEAAVLAEAIVKKIISAAPPSGSMVTKEVADRMIEFIQAKVSENPALLKEMVSIRGGDYLVALGFLVDLGFEL